MNFTSIFIKPLAIAALLMATPMCAHAKAPASATPRVMVFGDSLSAAYGIQAGQGWVALMAAALKSDGVEVINASISGETTRGGMARIKTDLAQHRPTHVLIALGANDGLRGLPVADTRKNLQAIVDAVKLADAWPVLIGIQIPPNYGPDYTSQFAAIYSSLAKAAKIPLVPFLLDGIADNLDFFQADRLHPTAEAQPKILQNVLPVLARAMKPAKTAAR